MIKEVTKPAKIAVCRECGGTGIKANLLGKPKQCPQCEGTGRVTVSGKMTLDIRPYKPEN